jgi:hypothetical protein
MPHHSAQFLGIDCHAFSIILKLFQEVASAPYPVNAPRIFSIGLDDCAEKMLKD